MTKAVKQCRESREQTGPDHAARWRATDAVGKNEAHRRENFESGEMPLPEAQNNRAHRAP